MILHLNEECWSDLSYLLFQETRDLSSIVILGEMDNYRLLFQRPLRWNDHKTLLHRDQHWVLRVRVWFCLLNNHIVCSKLINAPVDSLPADSRLDVILERKVDENAVFQVDDSLVFLFIRAKLINLGDDWIISGLDVWFEYLVFDGFGSLVHLNTTHI